MIASNNPIDFQSTFLIQRLPLSLNVNNDFPNLKSTVDVVNINTALITLSFGTNRVFVTFSASIITGTVSVTTGSETVTGENTDFVNELVIGDVVTINEEQLTVVEIVSNIEFTVGVPVTQASASAIIIP